jgi:prefoldin subunit 5
MAAAKKALGFLARRVVHLEEEIAELMDDLDQLTQQACPGLRLSTDTQKVLRIAS